jgi:hypothetical protein
MELFFIVSSNAERQKILGSRIFSWIISLSLPLGASGIKGMA